MTGIAIERGSLKLSSNLTGTAQTEIKSPDYQSVRSGIEKMIAPVENCSADPPKSPELMFAEGADMASLGAYSPAYISEVDYGKKY